MPYRDKDEFTMPSWHYWDLHYYLSKVETLVIIGWKGNEKHFNSVLQSQAKNIKKVIIADPRPKVLEGHLRFLVDDGAEIVRYQDFEEFSITGFDKEFF
jgi:hypothetical protein